MNLLGYNAMDKQDWIERSSLKEISVGPRVILLQEGELAQSIYFVKEGCVRLWFNSDGKEITNQFFFENSMVASIESFLTGLPSTFYMETIEKSVLYVLDKQQFEQMLKEDPLFKEWFDRHILERFIYYSKHLLSFLKDKPEERYRRLIEKDSEIIRRIPQHYIASFLGITPVSLSRIRNKVAREK